MTGCFLISELTSLISWEHFFFTWGVPSGSEAADGLKAEAENVLAELQETARVRYLLHPFDAHSDGDDIDFGQFRIPFLRQQQPNSEGYCLCLSDFVDADNDLVFVFATSVDNNNSHPIKHDPYRELMVQVLSDRLAEAAAEKLQLMVEEKYGFASCEIIRPAVGYPSIPDMSVNFILETYCRLSEIGILLTESGMMQPHSSVSGFLIHNPSAHYFGVGQISEEQVADYALRRGMPADKLKRFIYV